MQRFQEYLTKTEAATRVLLSGVDEYRKMLREAAELSTFTTSHRGFDDFEAQRAKWLDENAEKIARADFLYSNYFAESFSQATLCGSILQIASKAIEMFSANDSISPEVEAIVGRQDHIKLYCTGRKVRGLPIGLIIYAGRNQHMHFEDDLLRPAARKIFEHLATAWDPEGQVKDPAFDPQNPKLYSLAHNIVGLLGWKTYADFDRDLTDMLGEPQS